jgi:cysteine-rich repeat protein
MRQHIAMAAVTIACLSMACGRESNHVGPCGDGVVNSPELCDDGNTVGGDGCSANCMSTEKCGNHFTDFGEMCDDGNTVSGDGCDEWCHSDETCGNNIIDWDAQVRDRKSETCEPPGTEECNQWCHSPGCGNMDFEPELGEECDDGNWSDGDKCSHDCKITPENCGNFIIDAGEVCDDGNNQHGDGCSYDCRSDESCGNGIIDAYPGSTNQEVCDDGNKIDGDGCSQHCNSDETCGNGVTDFQLLEWCDPPGFKDLCDEYCHVTKCGNNKLDGDEECDDGNWDHGDGCAPDCTIQPIGCGDGVLKPGEDCEPPGFESLCRNDCTLTACGNGIVDAQENCDDGNWEHSDGCSPNCLSDETCGNGYLDDTLGEACDDGNTTDLDGCAADCRSDQTCGNGFVDEILDEDCEPPGSEIDSEHMCDPTCQETRCGNGVLEGSEECDDGNFDDGDGCSWKCHDQDPGCGDGVVDEETEEECDPPNLAIFCLDDCTLTTCGDGVVDEDEECDDGNMVSGDGCTAGCDIMPMNCGDGVLDPDEECDDGNQENGDGCSWKCTLQTIGCGDGKLDEAAGEVCDDGNNVSGDWCSADCKSTESCGNGIVDAGQEEMCDDGNKLSFDGCDKYCNSDEQCGTGIIDWHLAESCDPPGIDNLCLPGCKKTKCGNGIIDSSEKCDDGNWDNGDGCSWNCQLQAPSCGNGIVEAVEKCDPPDVGLVCLFDCTWNLCGNGILDPEEDCDDGNAVDDDGCTDDCDAVPPNCGDGELQLEEGEECDDGNQSNGDGCSWKCEDKPVGCGDGEVDAEAGEVCDDGNNEDGDWCSADCSSTESCGNSIVDLAQGEVCDDGNKDDGDGCNEHCSSNESCGNGFIDWDSGEKCDPPGHEGLCLDTCLKTHCGDGELNSTEECDDGNWDNNDGCSYNCKIQPAGCGNDIVEPELGETCDPPFLPGFCLFNCTITSCGNGVVDEGEECDDNNFIAGDGCSFNCVSQPIGCGNGIEEPELGEVCDDSNDVDGDWCSADCASTESCGNSIIDEAQGEVCDDGNKDDGDGCNEHCSSDETCGNNFIDWDIGENCDPPLADECSALCQKISCGNNILDPGEECDDGNWDSGDGCDWDCTLET